MRKGGRPERHGRGGFEFFAAGEDSFACAANHKARAERIRECPDEKLGAVHMMRGQEDAGHIDWCGSELGSNVVGQVASGRFRVGVTRKRGSKLKGSGRSG